MLLWSSTPISKTVQLERGGQFYREETGVPGEDNRPAARIERIYWVIKENRDDLKW